MVVWGVGGCDEGVSEKGCGRVVGCAAGMDEGPAGLGSGKTDGAHGGLGAMDWLPTESGIQTLDGCKVGAFLHRVERGRRERERERDREGEREKEITGIMHALRKRKKLYPLLYISILWALRQLYLRVFHASTDEYVHKPYASLRRRCNAHTRYHTPSSLYSTPRNARELRLLESMRSVFVPKGADERPNKPKTQSASHSFLPSMSLSSALPD